LSQQERFPCRFNLNLFLHSLSVAFDVLFVLSLCVLFLSPWAEKETNHLHGGEDKGLSLSLSLSLSFVRGIQTSLFNHLTKGVVRDVRDVQISVRAKLGQLFGGLSEQCI
jgi:hypothetical protein